MLFVERLPLLGGFSVLSCVREYLLSIPLHSHVPRSSLQGEIGERGPIGLQGIPGLAVRIVT